MHLILKSLVKFILPASLLLFVFGQNIKGESACPSSTLTLESEEDPCYLEDKEVPCTDSYPHKTTILKKCRPGYNGTGTTGNHTCKDGYWTVDQYCTLPCAPPASRYSEKDECYVKDKQVPCNDSYPTEISKKCQSNYNAFGTTANYTCTRGLWKEDQICVPVCGLSTGNNQFPWMVAIYDERMQFICTGTIITSFHILAATSCFREEFWLDGNFSRFSIIAGRHPRSSHKWKASLEKRKIAKWEAIESLSPFTDGLLLAEVDREFKFFGADNLSPVCVDWESIYEELDLRDGNQAISVGWHEQDGEMVPSSLNAVYWQKNTCARNILKSSAGYFDLLCVEHLNSSSPKQIQVDGSALLFKSDGRRYYLMGLTWDSSYARQYFGYTKVASRRRALANFISNSKKVQMSFRTIAWKPKDDGCILPESIENGNFTLTTGNSYNAGWRVSSRTTILLSCANNSDSIPLYFRCINDVWTPSIEKALCRKPGTCPSITASTSEDTICKLNGATQSCDSPPNNSTALVYCKPFHVYPGNRPIYKCQGGQWDQPITPCTLECGMKRVEATRLIINGEHAEPHEYPWVVAIYNSSNHQICGGSLISRRFVLSAAHCFTTKSGELQDKGGFTMVAGKYYRDIDIEEGSAQKRKIRAIHVHDNYRGSNHKYRDDIALIEVVEYFAPSWEVEPVCIDWENDYEDYDFTDGKEGVVTGWGYTTYIGEPSPVLKKLLVPFRDKNNCKKNLPHDFSDTYLVNDKICGGYKDNNTNVCQGDSGGGLYFKSDNKRYFIRGIASITVKSGVGCDPNRYALYTKVSTYLKWIETITRRVL